jgi:hypothetical protein
LIGEFMQELLTKLLPIFEETAIEAVETMLNRRVSIPHGLSLAPRLQNDMELSCNIGSCNERFQAMCSVGFNTEDGYILFPEHPDRDYQLDCLGEIGNTISGSLFSYPTFTSEFGILEQTPPVYSVCGAIFAKVWGVEGTLILEKAQMYFGYAIRKAPVYT